MMRGMTLPNAVKTMTRTLTVGRYAPLTAVVLLVAAVALGALTVSPTATRVAYYVVTGQ